MTDQKGPTNQLAGESSPYLLLHQHNPVDWYPWGEEALSRSREENKPIFLSVGYSTCYWCHVMARESFSDPTIAAAMNRDFINIKVDREERPDLDEIYMVATQIMTQQGGWPNSVFLTPELRPFFAGTYYPPIDRYGRPGFPTVLRSLVEAWTTRRSDLEEQAQSIVAAMERHLNSQDHPSDPPPAEETARTAQIGLERRFDPGWGGFGGAPKFPSPSNLYLLQELGRSESVQPRAAEMLSKTLDQIARGGIHDQLAGGFHRYATDREWKIPHFEKMLYDNGHLIELYAEEWARTADPQAARVVRQTSQFLGAEMTSPEGGFWSAIDAETDGREGAYYVWTRSDLRDVLSEEDFDFLAPLFGFSGSAFFEEDSYVLHLPDRLEAQAERRHTSGDDLIKQVESLRQALLAARSERQRPRTDDKILADWNGMAIAGLATAGRLLTEPGMVEQAANAAEFVLGSMRGDGGLLLHSWRQGQGSVEAFLADYAFLVRGLLSLFEARSQRHWLEAAIELTEQQIERLADPVGGFFSSTGRSDVLFRSKEVLDGATPAANAVAALNLLELARFTGESRWAELADSLLRAFGDTLRDSPDGARMLVIAALRNQLSRQTRSEPMRRTEISSSAQETPESLVSVSIQTETGHSGEWQSFVLTVEVSVGWHIYAADQDEAGVFSIQVLGDGVEVRALEYPEGAPLDAESSTGADSGIRVHEGVFEIHGELKARQDDESSLRLSYQPCSDTRCLQSTHLEIAIR